MTSGTADRRLRGALASVLVVLAGFTAVESDHPAARVVAAAPVPPVMAPVTRPPGLSATTPGGRPIPDRATKTTTPAAPGPRASGDGCGLSFSASAATVPVGHCHVVEIGDSIGNDIGWGLARHLSPASGMELHQLDRSATGLANTSYFDWASALESALHLYHPDLVLVCLGGNDQQGFEVDGSPAAFGSPRWEAAYLGRVRHIISEATGAGAEVLWVGLPIMEDPSYRAGALALDRIYQQAVAQDPAARYLSTWSLFADPTGAFRARGLVNGSPATLRDPDGIHLSFTGEDVAATYVIRAIASTGHVALVAGSPDVITGWV